jgi:hypothetical protein
VNRALGKVGAVWGVGGVLAILLSACARLGPYAADAVRQGLTPFQWLVGIVTVLFMGYSEGYRGFQIAFSPRVVARARTLVTDPRPVRIALAPLFCMGWIGATPRRLATSWGITVGIVILVVLVRHVPQPWRGVIDAGVVIGLAWGIVAIVWFSFEALRGRAPAISPDVP